jgi:hypothetical protein
MSESGIFKAAVKLSADQRTAYLNEACGSNAELRREVESLLRAYDASASFLQDHSSGSPATEDYEPITERPGMLIGPYKLMEQVGEGGMGLVFVAEQQHPVRRKVALKIIKPGLDWIVMKALEKDRTRRYETASAFAADVRHFLAEEPIEARSPSAGYKLKKFVQRNRATVLTAAAIAAALLVGTATATWQAVRATRAEMEARTEEARAVKETARAEEAEGLAKARLEELTAAKQQADEQAAIAKALNDFTFKSIFGEARAAADELTRITGEIVDGQTAKSKRAEFAASVRRFKRANDTVQSLAVKFSSLPDRQIGPEEEALFKATVKGEAEATQQMIKLVPLMQKYPNEMSELLSDELENVPKKK